ncbi:porin [Janthinobacterium sp. GB4P2]|uniref:porin n=1 Tax=Janthinobacterium sp. GB4P2 TaxID=3424189 RepID=UPI003F295828
MKHTLVAAAVLATLFAGSASAQSSVTVYGLLDAGLTSEHGGADGSVTKLATGVQSGSRIGFKGTEDLGNNLKANFLLENGLDVDTGANRQGALFGRKAYVGLSGGYGAVNLGLQHNPLFTALDNIDPFETGMTGASINLMSVASLRTKNSIMYETPKVNGLSAAVMVGLGEKPDSNTLGRTIDFSIDYANGPLVLTLAHDNRKDTPLNTAKVTLLGGTYDFGPAKLHAAYETDKDDAGTDFRDYMLGVSAPVGAAGSVMASYIRKDDRTNTRRGGRQLAIGYTYALSKRTNLYTSYGRINNDGAGTNFVGDASSGGSVPLPGHNSSAFTAGMRLKF